jgi:hypothetical protein
MATTVDPDVMIDIVADDKATGVLARTMAAVRGVGAQGQRMGQALAKASEAAGLPRLGEQAGKVGGAFLNLGSQVTSVLAPVAALGGALTLGGIAASVQGFVDRTGELADASARLGVSVEALQEFRYAAGLVGVEAGQMDAALQRLNKGLAEVAAGKNEDLAGLFKALGISVRDSNGQIRGAADLMPQLADAFARNENPALRTRMAMELFGKAGAALIPVLAQGSASLEATREEARRLGIVMGEDAVGSGDELGDSLDKLRLSATGLANALGAQLAPIIAPLIQGLTEWIAANREIVATSIAGAVEKVGAALSAVDWAGVAERIGAIASAVARAVEFVGGWEVALVALVALMNAGVIAALIAVGTSVAQLGAVLLANPITAAIVALAAAAALVYANWEPISAWFSGIVDGIAATWSGLVETVRGTLAEIGRAVDTVTGLPGRAASAVGNFASDAATGAIDFARDNRLTRLLGIAPDRPAPTPVNPVLPPMSGGPSRVEGQVDVRVTVAAPPGTQVETARSGDVDLATRQNLGPTGGF